jgi:hypothetical protein
MVGVRASTVMRLVLSAAVVTLLLLAIVPAASGREHAGSVRHVEISFGAFGLDLRMDTPITAEEAARHTRELRARIDDQPGDGPVSMSCGAVFSPSDENGRAHIERFCDRRQLRWIYRISQQVRAIIVGPVTETGLWYFIDGVRQPRTPRTSNLPTTSSTVL